MKYGRKVMMTCMKLLNHWYCVPYDVTDDEMHAALCGTFPLGVSWELLRDRLYGGFHCQEDPNRRHVFFDCGAYTYVNPGENRPLTLEERREQWNLLLEHNAEQIWRGGPFTEDCPRVKERVRRDTGKADRD